MFSDLVPFDRIKLELIPKVILISEILIFTTGMALFCGQGFPHNCSNYG